MEQDTQTSAPNQTESVQIQGRGTVTGLFEQVRIYLAIIGLLVALSIYLGITQPTFATWSNFVTILETNSVLLLVAIGLTFVLLTAGFDLSVGRFWIDASQ